MLARVRTAPAIVGSLALIVATDATAGPRPVSATLAASSTLGRGDAHAAWRAFDADVGTAWCQAVADDGTGGELEVRFAEPVDVQALEVHGAEPGGPGDEPRAPLTLTVTSDAGATTLAFDPWADEPAAITLPAGATRSLRFRIGPRASGPRTNGTTCLAEIHLQLLDRALVFGVPDAALAALPAAIATLDGALRRCDRKQLARLARYPVGVRETALGGRRAYPTGPGTDTDPRAFRRARDLPCTWIFHDDDGAAGPTLDGGIAPGVVRVIGGVAITTVYWELAWRARRWQLIAFDTVFFE